MNCQNCGSEIKESQKFCPKCGTKIAKEPNALKGKAKKNKGKKAQVIIACVCCVAILIISTIGVFLGSKILCTKDTNIDGITYFETKSKNVVLDNKTGIEYVNNEILITAISESKQEDIEKLISKSGGKIVGKIDLTNDYQVQLDKTYSFNEINNVIDSLFNSDIIKNISPNYAFHITPNSIDGNVYILNDKKWDSWDIPPSGNNWGLEAIEAPAAWSYNELFLPTNVGVFDNMFYTGHKDLTFTERPLGNVKYDYEKDVKFNNHGTHVAGTIAADFNNKKGISGVSINQNLYGFSYESFQDNATTYMFKVGFAYLVGIKNCKVVNISAGLDTLDFCADREAKNKSNSTPATDIIKLINDEIAKFLNALILSGKDFIICKSAGNQNSTDNESGYKYFKKDNDDNTYPYEYISYLDFCNYCNNEESEYEYPKYKDRTKEIEEKLEWGNVDTDNGFLCGITDEEIKNRIIVVGAIENEGNGKYDICDFSQCGKRVDVLAPGKDIFSTVKIRNKSGYDNDTGTSMATPLVSGVASLIYSLKPNIKGPTVKDVICNSGVGEYGEQKYKLLNAKNALDKANKIETIENNVTEDVEKNYGNVVRHNNCLYYWKYNSDSFSKEEANFAAYGYNENAKNQLICRTSDGKENVILTDNGFSEIAIANDRIYYQIAKNSYYTTLKSCSLKGDDIKEFGDGSLCGVVNDGKYVVFNTEYPSGVYSVDTSNNKKITLSNDDYLICNDDSIICTHSNQVEKLSEQEISIYKINGDGSNKEKLYLNKALELDSIKSISENGYYEAGYLDISLPYIKKNDLYFIFQHIAGTGHVTQSCRSVRINLDTGVSAELKVTYYEDSGALQKSSINDADYQEYIENYYNKKVLNNSDYSDFSNLELGEYGAEGSGALMLEFCEVIGDKQYILLTYGDFISWNGWRQTYKFKKCALYEKDLSSGKVIKIYDTTTSSDNNDSIYLAYLTQLNKACERVKQDSKNDSTTMEFNPTYTVYDIDKDGIKELIIKTGICEADYTYEFYTYQNGLISLGTTHAGHSGLYIPEDNNGLYLRYCPPPGDMYYVSLYRLTVKNNKLNTKILYKDKEISIEERDEFSKQYKYLDEVHASDLNKLKEL